MMMNNSVSFEKISFVFANRPLLRLASLCALWVLFSLTFFALVPRAHAQDETLEMTDPALKKKQEDAAEMRRKRAEKKRILDEIQAKKAGVKGQVAALAAERARLNELLINYGKRIQTSEGALSNLEKSLESLRGKETKMRSSMQVRRSAIADMLGVLQRMGRNPPPIMATHPDDALKMVRSAMLMSNILPKFKRQADVLRTEIDKLVVLKSDITEQSERLRVQNAEMEADRRRMSELLNEKNQRILSHNSELQQMEERAKEHSKSVANLDELISRVDKDLQIATDLGGYERQQIEDKKLAQQKIGEQAAVELTPDEKKEKAFGNPGRIQPALPFEKVKHTLTLPAKGRILRSFGEPIQYGNNSKGISIGTRPNAQITSPTDGWIVYAGKFRSYGQLLIINAGGKYHILLAGMERIDVRTGQFVLAGEPIGNMADKKISTKTPKKSIDPVLYIEFRKDGRPIDSTPWWATKVAAK